MTKGRPDSIADRVDDNSQLTWIPLNARQQSFLREYTFEPAEDAVSKPNTRSRKKKAAEKPVEPIKFEPTRWPLGNCEALSPLRMAESGLFYTPTAGKCSCVSCFACGVVIPEWDQTLGAYSGHYNASPNCPWLLQQLAVFYNAGDSHVVAFEPADEQEVKRPRRRKKKLATNAEGFTPTEVVTLTEHLHSLLVDTECREMLLKRLFLFGLGSHLFSTMGEALPLCDLLPDAAEAGAPTRQTRKRKKRAESGVAVTQLQSFPLLIFQWAQGGLFPTFSSEPASLCPVRCAYCGSDESIKAVSSYNHKATCLLLADKERELAKRKESGDDFGRQFEYTTTSVQLLEKTEETIQLKIQETQSTPFSTELCEKKLQTNCSAPTRTAVAADDTAAQEGQIEALDSLALSDETSEATVPMEQDTLLDADVDSLTPTRPAASALDSVKATDEVVIGPEDAETRKDKKPSPTPILTQVDTVQDVKASFPDGGLSPNGGDDPKVDAAELESELCSSGTLLTSVKTTDNATDFLTEEVAHMQMLEDNGQHTVSLNKPFTSAEEALSGPNTGAGSNYATVYSDMENGAEFGTRVSGSYAMAEWQTLEVDNAVNQMDGGADHLNLANVDAGSRLSRQPDCCTPTDNSKLESTLLVDETVSIASYAAISAAKLKTETEPADLDETKVTPIFNPESAVYSDDNLIVSKKIASKRKSGDKISPMPNSAVGKAFSEKPTSSWVESSQSDSVEAVFRPENSLNLDAAPSVAGADVDSQGKLDKEGPPSVQDRTPSKIVSKVDEGSLGQLEDVENTPPGRPAVSLKELQIVDHISPNFSKQRHGNASALTEAQLQLTVEEFLKQTVLDPEVGRVRNECQRLLNTIKATVEAVKSAVSLR